MKFPQSLVLFLTAALIIPTTLADFHVLNIGGGFQSKACPSNNLSCGCLTTSCSAYITSGNPQGTPFVKIAPGLCGAGELLLHTDVPGHWTLYENGAVKGWCYPNPGGTVSCPSAVFHDTLVCITPICNP
ncbi:hypothetical protein L208DRAFT_1404083 [Tricholoma matsutake]|nr:hypothetical protein L208DRAFT_1404083 [Tricholoma matsutake 945]